jgi:CRP/FNR family transcriptional regulator, nitrogen fixation regulation protein
MLRLSGQTTYPAARRIQTTLKFRKGEIIYAQGDAASDWYQVVSGTVRTCFLYRDGHRQLTGFYYDGDVFGIEAETYRSSAEAVTAVTLTRCGKAQDSAKTSDQVPETSSLLQSALNHAQSCISLLGRRTATERVAAFLLATAWRIGGTDSLNLPMTRADIADHLGLTIHTVSRTLSELARREIIHLDGPQSIAIRNPHLLRLLADGEVRDDSLEREEGIGTLACPTLVMTPATAFGR